MATDFVEQAAPANYPPRGLSTGRFEQNSFQVPNDKPRVESFAGAACLTASLGLLRTGKNTRGPWACPKAAPLQFNVRPTETLLAPDLSP
jgi:hypothetical protein